MSDIEVAGSRSLIGKAAYGFAWMFAWRMATRFMGIGSTLVLVRVLSPAEFGLVAMGLSFIQSVDQFSQIGVEEALIRLPTPSRRIYDTAFTLIALRCALIALCGAAAAFPVANYFNDPRLVPIVLTMSGVTLLGGLENIGVQDFRRDLRFDQEFWFQVIPRVGGVAATIFAVLTLRNYWALIIGTATTRALRVMASYVIHPYRPQFSLNAWRSLIGYSVWTWLICVARVVRDQSVNFVSGPSLGARSIGMITLASEVALLPSSEIVLPMGRSMFSAFAMAKRTGDDTEKLFRRLVSATALITVPASVGLALVASPVVRLMLGEIWMESVPLVQGFALGSAFVIFGQACHAQFDANNQLRHDLGVILFVALARLALLLALVPAYGLQGAGLAIALSFLMEPVAYLAVKKAAFPYSLRALSAVTIRPLVGTAAMAAIIGLLNPAAWLVRGGALDTFSATVSLGMNALVGAASYGLVVLLLWWLAGWPDGPERDLLGWVAGWLGRLGPAWRHRCS